MRPPVHNYSKEEMDALRARIAEVEKERTALAAKVLALLWKPVIPDLVHGMEQDEADFVRAVMLHKWAEAPDKAEYFERNKAKILEAIAMGKPPMTVPNTEVGGADA